MTAAPQKKAVCKAALFNLDESSGSLLRDFFFFLMIRPPPRSTQLRPLFPYTTLFRSEIFPVVRVGVVEEAVRLPGAPPNRPNDLRSEEHTSELQSPSVSPYAVFCL